MISSSRLRFAAVAWVTVLGLGLAGQQHGVAMAAAPPGVPDRQHAPDQRVTLITGDTVVVSGGDPRRAAIKRGPGRQGVSFTSRVVNGRLTVVPSDVQRALADGRLDRRLFDVTGLIEDGFGDRDSKVIPLLVTYAGKAKRVAPAGARMVRQLPVIGGAALVVDKTQASSFDTALTSAGIGKVWLDGKRKLSLDQSVPQIGGPVAWQAGWTGKGVTVAVLDSGIDATHPDLAPQVIGEKNFTDEPAADTVGHGTHVASTIAGTGAASGGKYKGVAPDAKLYDGKVCGDFGCDESAILAGMEWAATEAKADVVNLSLGGRDTPDLDPLEEAVNRLTAQTGTLFVVAAGNSGPGRESIESPGSADAALTVGNVDKQDGLNLTSSRGPRLGDSAVKPDVTAPGTDIVAAKSKDSTIGEPVGDQYLRLSGTSMATPHTAGAAALLLQEHPSWKAGEVKSALMGSARTAAGQSVFDQGSGRIDLTTAIKAPVLATPASLAFGTAAFPHTDDAPVSLDVAYRNNSDQPVTLALTASLTDPDGNAAPSSAVRLSADSLTIPAGGTATVQAVSDTRHDGPNGVYSGRIVATSPGGKVITPISVNKEAESYLLTIKNVGSAGQASDQASNYVWGVDQDVNENLADPSGTVQLRLPRGHYLAQANQVEWTSPSTIRTFALVQPEIELTADRTVVFDARTTKQVVTTVPRAGAEQILLDAGYDRFSPSGDRELLSSFLGDQRSPLFTAGIGPALPATQLTSHVSSQWGAPGAGGDFKNTPYLYGLMNAVPGTFPTGFHRVVKSGELAVVRETFAAGATPQAEWHTEPSIPGAGGAYQPVLTFDLPAKLEQHLEAGPTQWFDWYSEVMPSNDPDNPFPNIVGNFTSDHQIFRAGHRYDVSWNAAAAVPTLGASLRQGGNLRVGMGQYADAAGHVGSGLISSGTSKLYRDGKLIGSKDQYGDVQVSGQPVSAARYTFVTSGTRAAALTSRMDVRFTFSSAATQEETVSALRTVRYLPTVDDRNRVRRTSVTSLPVLMSQAADLPVLPAVRSVRVLVSGDGGRVWKAAAVVRGGEGYRAIFATPTGSSVSLKATVVDAGGNITEQTVIDAYLIR